MVEYCSVCEKEKRIPFEELCKCCKKITSLGKIWFIEIEDGTESDPQRTGNSFVVDKEMIETMLEEPIRSFILKLGFSFVTIEMGKTMGLT